ncbi:hypothetical protein DESPIG_01887 [Desulfovibrio piger ATCC 29098]|uniref:Uncharacterized protein n=1 Tax=Desulfovibrio piger ATCC 29098 TaxID=411464 RepID=B6WUX2_9BACT|nr:hypothetical protein DESPIG_01887 [Desulfovibrio piger ATCC 29098]
MPLCAGAARPAAGRSRMPVFCDGLSTVCGGQGDMPQARQGA